MLVPGSIGYRSLTALLAEVREQGARVSDAETAVVLRSIEEGARPRRSLDEGGTAYLELMARLLSGAPGADPAAPEPASPSSLILP